MMTGLRTISHLKCAMMFFSILFLSIRIVVCILALISVRNFDLATTFQQTFQQTSTTARLTARYHGSDVTNSDRALIACYLVMGSVVDIFGLIATTLESKVLLIVFASLGTISTIASMFVGLKIALTGIVTVLLSIWLAYAIMFRERDEKCDSYYFGSDARTISRMSWESPGYN